MIRSPAVAGQFYPADSGQLTANLAELIPSLSNQDKRDALAVVSPHAGYIYSGRVAGETLARVNIPDDVIILGPNHSGYGEKVALMTSGSWQMPMGQVAINEELANGLMQSSQLIESDELAHRFEHSLEVQVPFLQILVENLKIVPLVVSHISYDDCVTVGNSLAEAVKNFGKPVLVLASSDMTHYESRKEASAKDKLAIDNIRRLDPKGLYNTVIGERISMCGIMPTTVALIAALKLGAKEAELVRYTDSGDTSGDTSQVVGYAGLIIT